MFFGCDMLVRDLKDNYLAVDVVAILLSTLYAPGPGNLSGSSNVVVIAQSGNGKLSY